jgi:tetratricopeptide (TPR) repeat protein
MHVDTARVFATQTGRKGTYSEISSYFLEEGLGYLTADLGRAVRLALRKFYWFLTGRHYGDIYYPSLEQADGWINLLPLAPVPTAWLIGPALVGLLILRKQRLLHAFDWAMVLLPILIIVAFWYSPRYRLPALPILVVASAGALASVVRRFRMQGSWKGSSGLLAGAFAASIAMGFVNQAIGFDQADGYRPQYESNRGHVYATLGDYDSALERFIKSDRLKPDQPNVLAAMAEAYTRVARYAEAEQICGRLMDVTPNSLAAWSAQGSLDCARGEWAGAQEAFEKCLAIDPLNIDAHWGMWLAYSNRGQTADGMMHLQEVIRLDPDHATAASEYGILLSQSGNLHQAEHYLRLARRLSSGQPQAHFNLGMMLMEAGRTNEAVTCLVEALQLDPAYEAARRALARIESRSRLAQPADSIEELEKRIEHSPGDAALYSRLAGLWYARGNSARAVSALRKGVTHAENSTTVAVELAWLLATSPDDSIREGDSAVSLALDVLGKTPEPPPEYLDVLAAALAEAGQFDRARQEAQRAVAIASRQGRADLASAIQRRADLYKSHKPFRR